MKLLDSLRVFLLSVLSVLVILITLPFVAFPWFREINKVQGDMKFVKEEIENKLEPKLEILESQDVEILKTDILKLESVLPSEENASSTLGSFQKITRLSGTEIKGIQYRSEEETPEKKDSLQTLSFSVSLTGVYADFTTILKSIEKARPFFDVKQFQISQTEEGLRGALEIYSYYKPLPLSIGEVTSPVSRLTIEEEETLVKVGDFVNYAISPATGVDLGKTNLFE